MNEAMILLENSILRLDYDPATDILCVRYPDLQRFHLSEIKHSLQVMVETIRNYDVRKLLLDARTTAIELNNEENKQLTLAFAAMLSKTRLLKVARLKPFILEDEARAQQNIDAARAAGLLTYEVSTFTSLEEAIAWLQA